MSAPRQLSADSSVGTWLDDPHGGPVLRALLAAGGSDERSLRPVRRLALRRLVPMSRGQLSQEAVDDLVRQAHLAQQGATGPDAGATGVATSTDVPSSEVGQTGAPDAGDAGQTPDAGRPAWVERLSPGRFTGHTVVVTGAGSGIGRATASRIAREGGRVVAVDVVASRLDGLAAAFRAQPGGEAVGDDAVVTVAADVTDPDGVAAIVAAAGPGVTALANIAGVMDDMTPVHEVSDAVWERVLRINVDGMMRLTRAVIPALLARGGGSVVNVASEAALRGSAAGVAYTTSKHAVVGLTKSSAVMYAPSGIRVNAVAPGPVITGIEASFASELGQERIGSLLETIPEPVEPDQLAASITFLLSDDGVNVTGVVLASDGGWSAQ